MGGQSRAGRNGLGGKAWGWEERYWSGTWDLEVDWDLEESENENGEEREEADRPVRSRGMEIDEGGRRRIDLGGGGGGEGRRGKRMVGEGSSGSAGEERRQ